MPYVSGSVIEEGSIKNIFDAGIPVQDAEVFLEAVNKSTKTDSRGRFSFHLSYQEWGTLRGQGSVAVTVRHPQYHTQRKVQNFKTQDILTESVHLYITMVKVGPGQTPSAGPVPVQFHVRDKRTGALVGGAKLVITGGGTEYTRIAGNGTASLDLLQNVMYTVRASAPGYKETTVNVVP